MSRLRLPLAAALLVALLASALAPSRADAQPRPRSRYGQGSMLVSLGLGVEIGNQRTRAAASASFGYAVLDGMVPGLRGMVVFSDPAAGELAPNLFLTIPVDFPVLPFAYGEAGRRFDGAGGAWLLGGGGGLQFGYPRSPFGFQVGWLFRRYFYTDVSVDGSGLLLAATISF